MKKRLSDQQIISILREAEAGVSARELCRKHAISDIRIPVLSPIISFLKDLIIRKWVWKQGHFASGFTIHSRALAWTLIVSMPAMFMQHCRCS